MIIDDPNSLSEYHFREKVNNEWYLYFLWCRDHLLYIGITQSLQDRMRSHWNEKPITRVTYQLFKNTSKSEMLRVERSNIIEHRPPLNDNSAQLITTRNFAYLKKEGYLIEEGKDLIVEINDNKYNFYTYDASLMELHEYTFVNNQYQHVINRSKLSFIKGIDTSKKVWMKKIDKKVVSLENVEEYPKWIEVN